MTDTRPPILNIDDSEAGRYARTRILQGAGYRVVEAGTGEAALTLVRTLEPPLVLLDVQLPDMSGLEVCRLIKRDYPSVLVLQISATYTGTDARTRGLDAGADSYLSEPVEPEELIANVHALLRLKSAEEQLKQLNETLEKRIAERTEEIQTINSQLVQSQKLEALGHLTGGIAHDFNNLLAAILGNMRLLRKRLSGDPALLRLVDGAIEGAQRGASLTQRLLMFARSKELQMRPVDVAGLVRGMFDMLRRSIEQRIRIDLDLPGDLWLALVDNDQLELALLNLALNARDAMPDGGTLTIRARNEHVSTATDTLRPGDYLHLSVSDTGIGMDAATLARAIDPFFTTKDVGKGTGLGLSMVQGLAVQAGGALRLRSHVGAGTTVDLWLTRAEATAATADDVRAPGNDRPYRVLLVEDDPLILMSTDEMLKDMGHTVYPAASGAEAIRLLQSGKRIDVVVTDQGMPQMTGLQLAERIKATWPKLPVLIVTGYGELPKSALEAIPRLSKPYQPEDLAQAIGRLMQASLAGETSPVS